MRAPENIKGPEHLGAPSKGFALIELLIVVAIILIIAAIAIPNFIRAKMQAHESAAAHDLRAITTAEVIHSTTYFSLRSPDLRRSPASFLPVTLMS